MPAMLPPPQQQPPPHSHDHRSTSDFVNELITGSLRTKKSIQKKGKRTKRQPNSRQSSSKRSFIGDDPESGGLGEDGEALDELDEEEAPTDEWVKSNYQEAMKLMEKYHTEQGQKFTPVEFGVQSNQPLVDDPEFDDVSYDGDCIACSWIFIDRSTGQQDAQFKQVKQHAIPRINEYIFRLSLLDVPINIIANIVHQYYVGSIYKPLIDSGHVDVPLWRTKSIKMHIEGHIDHPRLVLKQMCRRVIENLNVIGGEKYEKSKTRNGVVKTNKEALEKEEKQMKLLLHLKSKDPTSMSFSSANNGQTDSLKRILEDMEMGIKYS
jgi:hypothetical protein